LKAIELRKIVEELPDDTELYVYQGKFLEDKSPIKFMKTSDIPDYYRNGVFVKLDLIVVFT